MNVIKCLSKYFKTKHARIQDIFYKRISSQAGGKKRSVLSKVCEKESLGFYVYTQCRTCFKYFSRKKYLAT